jgi:hypothetical protein
MLSGIETRSIVVGADGDPRGGVCPIYATPSPPSRQIGRPFARAWDRYSGARLPRPASERETRALRSMLEASIELETEPVVSLRAGIAAHKASQARSRAASAVGEGESRAEARGLAGRLDLGGRDRTDELSGRDGWAWLRPFRRYDEYERALRALDGIPEEACAESGPQRLVPSGSGCG